jgi:rhodanese-related sulfurtransferase
MANRLEMDVRLVNQGQDRGNIAAGAWSSWVEPKKRFLMTRVDAPWRIGASLFMFPIGGLWGCRIILKCRALVISTLKDSQVKFILDNWMMIAVALASGGMLLWPLISAGGPGSLTADAAVQLINREKAVVVDVCEADEFAAGHVVGAKNIPLAQLEEKLVAAVKNKTLPLILVCKSGNRSGRAVATAKKLGFEKALSLSGGMGAWRAANLPVEKA